MKLIRPATVTDSVLKSTTVADPDAPYSTTTTYAKDAVVQSADHQRYQSLIASNLNKPLTDGASWKALGPTNRWAMFDQTVGSQTTAANIISVVLQATSRIDSVALLNISAGSVHVTMTDATDGLVYDRTVSLISDVGINDYDDWFFEPVDRLTSLILTDLPPYSNALVSITLSDFGATVACGVCVFGQSRYIGETEISPHLSIQDFSRKDQDAFGNFDVTERAYSDEANFTVWVDNTFVDRLKPLLAGYRAMPIVYVGDENYACTIIYGFYKTFAVEIAGPDYSVCTLELVSLT